MEHPTVCSSGRRSARRLRSISTPRPHVAQPDDLATVIYTSGTTGDPKGVMLDHTNVCWTKESLRLALDFSTEGFRVVSYLPMAHIAERMVSHYSGLALGYEVTTCPDLHLVLAAFQETKPQLLFGVPRTYERINSGVRAVLAGDAEREAAFDRALAVGREVAAVRARGDEPGGDLAGKWEHVDAETLRPVRELLGLGEVRCAVTAAAPMPVEILDFFRAPRCAALGDVRTVGVVGAGHVGAETRTPRHGRPSDPRARAPARRPTARCSAAAATSSAATSAIPPAPRKRSMPTVGCTRETSASSTPTGISASSTARRS